MKNENPFFKSGKEIPLKNLKIKYPEYYKKILKIDGKTITEKIWLYQNNLIQAPKCKNFDCCNKCLFKKFSQGYTIYCSKKCAATYTNKNLEIKNKRIIKIIEYNNDPILKKEITEKSNITKKNFSDEKKKQVLEKISKTCLEKYGVDNISKSLETNINKGNNILKSKNKNVKIKTKKRIENLGFNLISMNKIYFNLKCPKCKKSFKIKKSLFNQRNRFDISICLNCNPISKNSDFQNCVFNFVKEIYKGEIINNFKKFKKFEIDIFLPEINIGIECNGLWWHSELYKDKNYHLDKKNFFITKKIQILNIWEDDWKFKKEIVKSRIKSQLKIINNKIYARKCKIAYINSKESESFLYENHIQGSCISSIKIGLLYNNEIVSLATFGKCRKNLGKTKKDGEFELIRFCSKNDTIVLGSLSKIISFFIKEKSPKSIFSYCDYGWYKGESYLKSGFTYIKNTVSNYFYFHKDECIRKNRWIFRKNKLIEEGFDKNKTEIEIMKDRGYYRIWDCGSKLFIYKIK